MSNIPVDASLNKGGENVITTSLRRSKGGVWISIRAHSSIEQLCSNWGNGRSQNVIEYDRRFWKPLGDQKLKVYDLLQNPGIVFYGRGSYRIDQPGGQIIQVPGEEACVNLSFLRLVGISEGTGIQFELPGVFTTDALREMAKQITDASRRFYLDYLVPVDLTIKVTTSLQESRL